ncbi:MAG: FtsX-like permease family protein [Bacteroides sp.]|nr:FtsX-like permease family protein [Bacteroides sp.]
MFTFIFHQLWNQRRQNGWIFLELLVAGFFLWTVIDPVAVLTANHRIDKGYNSDRLYLVEVGAYDATNGNYRAEADNDSLRKAAYERMARTLRELPEVGSFAIVYLQSIPNGVTWSGTQLFPDTAAVSRDNGFVHAQQYRFITGDGSNPFHTYGMKDALTGGDLKLPADPRDQVFISERLAQRLFGTSDVTGRKVYGGNRSELTVAGVFANFKHRDYEQPYPLAISLESEMRASRYMHWQYCFAIRLKDGVDAAAFERRFNDEVKPMLSMGNYYCDRLETFNRQSAIYAARSGVTNKLRLQYSLTGFTILCVFLGMVGTFWIRCNARRQEIGVMCSMGASRRTICRQFLIESWMLVTIAFIVVLPLLLHHAWINGFYVMEMNDEFVSDPAYWQNRFGAHFCIVSLLTYVLLLAVALIGTYIPVLRASRTRPAEALRDE